MDCPRNWKAVRMRAFSRLRWRRGYDGRHEIGCWNLRRSRCVCRSITSKFWSCCGVRPLERGNRNLRAACPFFLSRGKKVTSMRSCCDPGSPYVDVGQILLVVVNGICLIGRETGDRKGDWRHLGRLGRVAEGIAPLRSHRSGKQRGRFAEIRNAFAFTSNSAPFMRSYGVDKKAIEFALPVQRHNEFEGKIRILCGKHWIFIGFMSIL